MEISLPDEEKERTMKLVRIAENLGEVFPGHPLALPMQSHGKLILP